MEVKFFNILDVKTFSQKTESEQKAILIEANIYKKGKSNKEPISLEEGEIWKGGSYYSKFIGQHFEFNRVNYKLNDDFLNEVFNECVSYIKHNLTPLIDTQIETLKLQTDINGDDFVSELYQNEIKNYTNYLPKKLFKELHNSDFENEQEHFDILKRYLAVNWYDLSNYLFGTRIVSSYHIFTTYYSYVRMNRILLFLNSKNVIEELVEKDNQKISRPKFIAMLNELGFFKWESIKDLSNDQKAKIILALLQQDSNNENTIHNVVKNMQTLNSKSELNNKKYTAWTHMEAVKKIFNKITNKL